jgi:hypothetical protein
MQGKTLIDVVMVTAGSVSPIGTTAHSKDENVTHLAMNPTRFLGMARDALMPKFDL